MKVALKIWRYESSTGQKALKEYEFDAPEEATLLDCLDIVKDRHDGTLAYRKSCRMMICGSCGMRMDGAAVLACCTPMYEIAQAGRVPVISAMGNLPVVKDLVVDMEPFWTKFKAMKPWLQPGYAEPPEGKEYLVTQPEMNPIHKESLCINCGCCVSECNAMDSDPEFLGPQALAKGMRFVGDPRDHATVERLEEYSGQHGIWECTRCYFCNERCPKGVDPRDAIAKLGAEAVTAGSRPRHGREAREVVRHLGEDDGLAARDRARAEDAGRSSARSRTPGSRSASRGRARCRSPFPPHVAKDVDESRALYDLVKAQGRDGATGIVQGEKALARLDHGVHGEERDPYGPGSFPQPYLPGEEEAAQ